jgi:two-component system, cell cycle sensor histidine kinase and response regulator CckA
MPTILLVDDEKSVRNALRKILERGGMTVREAASAREALGLVDGGQVDAVVSDVLMPEMSGLSFYDELITRSPGLAGRVIFLTGAARDPAIHTPIEQRGVPLISKLDDLMLVLDALRLVTMRK